MARTQIQSPGIADNSISPAKLDSTVSGALVPIGGIIMWSGVTIPSSWALCDGQTVNGQVTPNLQDRFVVGAGSGYAIGATGGSADATLVSHSHTATSTATDSGHTHSYNESYNGNRKITGNAPSCNTGVFESTTGTGYANVTVDTTISTEGFPATDKNLPPYYALAFIMRVS